MIAGRSCGADPLSEIGVEPGCDRVRQAAIRPAASAGRRLLIAVMSWSCRRDSAANSALAAIGSSPATA